MQGGGGGQANNGGQSYNSGQANNGGQDNLQINARNNNKKNEKNGNTYG